MKSITIFEKLDKGTDGLIGDDLTNEMRVNTSTEKRF